MSKTMTVTLAGKELVLNLGTNRLYHLFKESTGEDLLLFGEGFDAVKLVTMAQGITYAGYYSECKLNKVQPEFTKEEIFELVFDADQKYCAEIYNKINELNKQPGELDSQLKESALTS